MKMRALFMSALLCASVGTANASEQDIQRAYDAARRCYVANGNVYSAFKRNGDSANTKLFDKKAHTAYDLAYFYGDMLHLSRGQISADIQTTTDSELPKLVKDSNYLTDVAKDCKHWGMM